MNDLLPRLVALVLTLALFVGVVVADEDDHEVARRLRQQGEILPLEAILERLPGAADGRLLEIELERENGQWIYELEVLDSEGRVREYSLDAAKGELIGTEAEEAEDE